MKTETDIVIGVTLREFIAIVAYMTNSGDCFGKHTICPATAVEVPASNLLLNRAKCAKKCGVLLRAD